MEPALPCTEIKVVHANAHQHQRASALFFVQLIARKPIARDIPQPLFHKTTF
jgi:hypothetical protein